MGRSRNSQNSWLPVRVYRGRSAYEWRMPDGRCIRLCPLDAPPEQVLGCYRDAAAGMEAVPRRFRIPDVQYEDMYIALTRRTRGTARALELTRDEFWQMVRRANGRCELSGILFHNRRMAGRRRAPYAPSIDRIDSKSGYTASNTRLVCVAVNLALNEFGDEVLIRIALRLASEYTVKRKREFARIRASNIASRNEVSD